MNWAYRVSGKKVSGKKTSTLKSLVALKDVRVHVAADFTRATSTVLNKPLTVEGSTILLPELQEGDVIRLD
jgi:hypothetical protein